MNLFRSGINGRYFLLTILIAWGTLCSSIQAQLPMRLVNPGLETVGADGLPVGWRFTPAGGRTLSVEEQNVFNGTRAAVLDSTKLTEAQANSGFGNASQVLDGKPYRGKRVRFRVAVRTDDLEDGGRAQLWFRVDKKSVGGQPSMGAFDNMQNRPIRSSEWGHHDIVLDVDEDAERILVGVLLIGKGKAFFDDASFEVVDESVATTNMMTGGRTNSGDATDSEEDANAQNAQSALMRAFSEAENAPQQPFFVNWLWLAVIAIVLFLLSHRMPEQFDDKEVVMGFIPKFALRFSVAYWLLYSLPQPFTRFLPYVGAKITAWYSKLNDTVVRWTASEVLGIEQVLVAPNGSGDTTFAYVKLLICFVLAIAIAILWTSVDWRRTDYRCVKDLLRSYLRYVLALTMLSYGISKVGYAFTQFSEPSVIQLAKTYGDSSPMNLVWTFMGTSHAYMTFAGLGEIVGGLLLLFRRTTMIGAMVVIGVMTNVVMLNFCFDVPVKQYSAHLLAMAFFLLLPDARRLGNLLFFNRMVQPTEFRPPYTTNSVAIWVQRGIKLAILVVAVGMPFYQKIKMEVEYADSLAEVPMFFGAYAVEEFRRDGKVVEPSLEDVYLWKTVTFERMPYNMSGQPGPSDVMSIGFRESGIRGIPMEISLDENTVTLQSGSSIVPPQIELKPMKEDRLQVTGTTSAGPIEVVLKRKDKDLYRLTGRGFRWINEVPFNR